MTIEMKPAPCLNCGRVNDRVSGAFDARDVPVAGDVVMCIGCGHLAAYDATAETLRELTAEELVEVMQDPDVQRAQWARRMTEC